MQMTADKFDPVNLGAFRRQHPTGENVVLAEDVKRTFTRTYGPLSVRLSLWKSSSMACLFNVEILVPGGCRSPTVEPLVEGHRFLY